MNRPHGRPPRPLPAPTWRRIAVSYALVAAVPFVLWTVSHPVAGVALLATVALLARTARRLVALGRCLRDCGGFTLDAGRVRVHVTRAGADD